MLACGKSMPINNQFSVLRPELFKNFPEKVKNYPEKNLPKRRMLSSRMRTAHSSSHLLGGLPQCMLGYTPWVWAWRPLPAKPLNFPTGCGPGDPPCRQTDTCRNITFANFVCGRYFRNVYPEKKIYPIHAVQPL